MNDLMNRLRGGVQHKIWECGETVISAGPDIAKANSAMAEAADHIEAQNELISEMREALEASKVGLEDWLNIYAAELCDEARVAEAIKRVNDIGTLDYIAEITAKINDALSKSNPNTPERNDE